MKRITPAGIFWIAYMLLVGGLYGWSAYQLLAILKASV